MLTWLQNEDHKQKCFPKVEVPCAYINTHIYLYALVDGEIDSGTAAGVHSKALDGSGGKTTKCSVSINVMNPPCPGVSGSVGDR